jgi:hypothetical protein
MVPALVLSAMGAWLHNMLEGIPALSIETASALIPTLVLVIWWWKGEGGETLWWITLVWVLGLNAIVGALLSVLPLPVWPFLPEQSLGHYLAHGIFVVTQIPALVLLWRFQPKRALT